MVTHNHFVIPATVLEKFRYDIMSILPWANPSQICQIQLDPVTFFASLICPHGTTSYILSNLDLAWDLKLLEAKLLAVVDEFPECCAGNVHVVTHVL